MSLASPRLSLSVVSHGQSALVCQLLGDLARLSPPGIEVLLTINIPEQEQPYADCPFPVRVSRNATPKGFGANHNAAFQTARGEYFAVVNPDIRLATLDLDALLCPLADPAVAAVAPVVLSADGKVEDSARHFPTFLRLARRVVLGQRNPDYAWDREPIGVDWAAGMFVVFRSEAYRAVGGFDDRRFFMYFEDVDICERLRNLGTRVVLQPQLKVVHDARRASHRDLKHLRWHLASAVRYLTGL